MLQVLSDTIDEGISADFQDLQKLSLQLKYHVDRGADMRVEFPLTVRERKREKRRESALTFAMEITAGCKPFSSAPGGCRWNCSQDSALCASIKVKCIHYAQHFAWLLIQLSGVKHIFQLVTNSTEFATDNERGCHTTLTHTHVCV